MSKSSKLVDYDGDSSDDEENSGPPTSMKLPRDVREAFNAVKNYCPPSSSKNSNTNGNGCTVSSQGSKSPSSHNGNAHNSLSNGVDANGAGTSSSNSSTTSNGSTSRGSSPKNGSSNVKPEHTNGSSLEKSKDKWYHKGRSDSSEQKVYTKASAAVSNKGWHVCTDSPSPSSTAAATNGWSVSDNVS